MTDGGDVDKLLAWADVVDEANYYELLGVLELADAEAIKIAFHEFALIFHPDVHDGADEEARELAGQIFRRGAEAYRVLSDPELRAKYDLALASGHLRLIGGEPSHRVIQEGSLKSLEDICRSPAAKLLARRADESITKGALADARRLLKEALLLDDDDNPGLQERIEALNMALFAMGE